MGFGTGTAGEVAIAGVGGSEGLFLQNRAGDHGSHLGILRFYR